MKKVNAFREVYDGDIDNGNGGINSLRDTLGEIESYLAGKEITSIRELRDLKWEVKNLKDDCGHCGVWETCDEMLDVINTLEFDF